MFSLTRSPRAAGRTSGSTVTSRRSDIASSPIGSPPRSEISSRAARPTRDRESGARRRRAPAGSHRARDEALAVRERGVPSLGPRRGLAGNDRGRWRVGGVAGLALGLRRPSRGGGYPAARAALARRPGAQPSLFP